MEDIQKGVAGPAAPPEFHKVTGFLARVISIVFHPLFIPVYLLWFFLQVNPVMQLEPAQKNRLIISFSIMYILFPLVTVLLAKALGFISTITLKTQRDRIVPYVASVIYYFWMWYVLRGQPDFPRPLVMLALGIFLAASAGLLLNGFIKASMHGISIGVALTFVYLLGFIYEINIGIYLSVALLIGGLVCTARMVNRDHSPGEVYLGLFLGIAAQLIAYAFL